MSLSPLTSRLEIESAYGAMPQRIQAGTQVTWVSRSLVRSSLVRSSVALRLWSIRETCRQKDRPLFDYLVQAITQHTAGKPVPPVVA